MSCYIGVDYKGDITESESRVPTYHRYLRQKEYVAQPNGDYEEVTSYPEVNVTTFPSPSGDPGSLKVYVEQRKREISDEDDENAEERADPSVTSQQFENAYTKYSYGTNTGNDNKGQAENVGEESVRSIQDIIHHKQGEYGVPTGPGNSGSPSYDAVSYQNPLVPGYDGPSHYFPSDGFQWQSSYGVPGGSQEGGYPEAPFLSVGHGGYQKAKTAFQFGDIIKNTGDAVNNAILNKGSTAAAVVGQTVQTAGEVLKNKGATATKIIQNKGQLATSAIQSAGNIGASLLRSKGELVGAVLKTGAAIGTTALGTASNALAGGTNLVRAKGDAASTVISKGGQLASGVIGAKGRLISSVINAKGQFAANIIATKGRAVATVLETGGQKLNQLAEAIKSVTTPKKPVVPEIPYGWSDPAATFADLPSNQNHVKQEIPQIHATVAQLHEAEEPILPAHQQSNQYQQDYDDTYYNPRDNYRSDAATNDAASTAEKLNNKYNSINSHRVPTSIRSNHNARRPAPQVSIEEPEEDLFQNDYTQYYPHHYQRRHTDYYNNYSWE